MSGRNGEASDDSPLRAFGFPHRVNAHASSLSISGVSKMYSLPGGSSMFASLLPQGGVNMGDRNVDACRRALGQAQISLIAQDTGGTYGRSVFLHIRDGRVIVRSLAHGEKVL